MGMTHLVYYSEKKNLGPGGVFRLLDQARAGNERDELTGVLIFSHRYFLQHLEGPREQVSKSFLRIAADERHSDVTLISVVEREQRRFPKWTMGALNTDSLSLREAMKDLLPNFDFAPARMTADDADALLLRMVDLNYTYDY